MNGRRNGPPRGGQPPEGSSRGDAPSPWSTARPRGVALRGPARASAGRDAAPSPASALADEQRLYGLHACLAAFACRPDDLRKVYLDESRIGALKAVLAWCVARRIGYRVVAGTDLDKLTGSRHHEGVCFQMRRAVSPTLAERLAALPPAAPALLVWLDGVGNPHNLGALLRSAAHFGAAAVIVPADDAIDVSGAAARVAEGGAEAVPLLRAADPVAALAALRAAGFAIAATVPREGRGLYEGVLPARLVLVFGAEGEGMSAELIGAADLRVTIPGSGAVESLNISASAAVLFAEWWRQHAGATP